MPTPVKQSNNNDSLSNTEPADPAFLSSPLIARNKLIQISEIALKTSLSRNHKQKSARSFNSASDSSYTSLPHARDSLIAFNTQHLYPLNQNPDPSNPNSSSNTTNTTDIDLPTPLQTDHNKRSDHVIFSAQLPSSKQRSISPINTPTTRSEADDNESHYADAEEDENMHHRDSNTLKKTNEADPDRWWHNFFLLLFFVLIVSILFGVFFFSWLNDWTWTTALLFSSSVLCGPSFDRPLQLHPYGYNFALAYYIYGQSFFVWTISSGVAHIMTTAPEISAQLRQKLQRMDEPEDSDGDGIISTLDWCNFSYNNVLWMIGWESHSQKYLVGFATIAWFILGIGYSVFYEGWELGASVYFVLNCLLQWGFVYPPCETGSDEDNDCDFGLFRSLFISTYLVVGCPLFALAISQFANIAIERSILANEKSILKRPLTLEEFSFASNLYGDDELLSLAEFTILELLRLRRVTMEDLNLIKDIYIDIDDTQTANIDRTTLMASKNLFNVDPSNTEVGNGVVEGYGATTVLGGENFAQLTATNIEAAASLRINIVMSSDSTGDDVVIDRDRDRDRRTGADTGTIASNVNVLLGMKDAVTRSLGWDRPGTPLGDSAESNRDVIERRRRSFVSGGSSTDHDGETAAEEEDEEEIIPEGIRRLTFKQYNNVVVPMTLEWTIPNEYWTEEAEDEDEEGLVDALEEELEDEEMGMGLEKDEENPDLDEPDELTRLV